MENGLKNLLQRSRYVSRCVKKLGDLLQRYPINPKTVLFQVSLSFSPSLFMIHRRKTVSSNMAYTCRGKIGVYETKKIGISESGSRNEHRSG